MKHMRIEHYMKHMWIEPYIKLLYNIEVLCTIVDSVKAKIVTQKIGRGGIIFNVSTRDQMK